jgi:hypothetical protein
MREWILWESVWTGHRGEWCVTSHHYVVHSLMHYINMAYSQPKYVAVWTALIYGIAVLNWKLSVIWKPPFCRQGMRSDEFYFMTFCWDLSQTDLTKVQLALSSSSVAANSWMFQISVAERTAEWSYLLCTSVQNRTAVCISLTAISQRILPLYFSHSSFLIINVAESRCNKMPVVI